MGFIKGMRRGLLRRRKNDPTHQITDVQKKPSIVAQSKEPLLLEPEAPTVKSIVQAEDQLDLNSIREEPPEEATIGTYEDQSYVTGADATAVTLDDLRSTGGDSLASVVYFCFTCYGIAGEDLVESPAKRSSEWFGGKGTTQPDIKSVLSDGSDNSMDDRIRKLGLESQRSRSAASKYAPPPFQLNSWDTPDGL